MKVYQLLNEPSKWTKKLYAADINGQTIDSLNSCAVSWCLAGAINKCYPYEFSKVMDMVELEIKQYIPTWNDTHTYEEVIDLCKKLNI